MLNSYDKSMVLLPEKWIDLTGLESAQIIEPIDLRESILDQVRLALSTQIGLPKSVEERLKEVEVSQQMFNKSLQNLWCSHCLR
ncbi:hypothetical protein [Endozoicomonas sp. SCSIO W0465]|uniref:hypothetical protein n=1 Tax=Endozoicomonas sp. SCSIO W0465 TaxID=2918516 RepID=UPI00207617CE|nr:hypothetical protein [Endozoicomonas sp. SCSIO W0465]USE35037.1 hypothetical protein MJO57_23415 [Endozoicomonas sp. SCSIO W0465]